MSEQRDNSAVLFKNDRKEQDNHPDYKGWGMVGGTEVWISAWIKQGKNGKFMSLSIKAKDAKTDRKPQETRKGDIHDMESDIPF